MNLLDRLKINAEIRMAEKGLRHYETAREADDKINLAYSVLKKYTGRISPQLAAHFEKEIRNAEIDLKNNFIMGYII